jgi:hypothetical protein
MWENGGKAPRILQLGSFVVAVHNPAAVSVTQKAEPSGGGEAETKPCPCRDTNPSHYAD